MDSFQECPICSEDLINPFKTTCCKQKLHLECFEKCVNNNSKCPFCRTSHLFFTDIQIQNDRQDIHEIHNIHEIHIIQNIRNIQIIQEIPSVYRRRFTCLILLSCCYFLSIVWIPPVLYYQVHQIYLNKYNYSNYNNITHHYG
jgi:hypothetical protein